MPPLHQVLQCAVQGRLQLGGGRGRLASPQQLLCLLQQLGLGQGGVPCRQGRLQHVHEGSVQARRAEAGVGGAVDAAGQGVGSGEGHTGHRQGQAVRLGTQHGEGGGGGAEGLDAAVRQTRAGAVPLQECDEFLGTALGAPLLGQIPQHGGAHPLHSGQLHEAAVLVVQHRHGVVTKCFHDAGRHLGPDALEQAAAEEGSHLLCVGLGGVSLGRAAGVQGVRRSLHLQLLAIGRVLHEVPRQRQGHAPAEHAQAALSSRCEQGAPSHCRLPLAVLRLLHAHLQHCKVPAICLKDDPGDTAAHRVQQPPLAGCQHHAERFERNAGSITQAGDLGHISA